MPNTRSAKKQLRQNVKRRLRNRSRKSRMRSAATTYQETLASGELEAAPNQLRAAMSLVDRGAKQGLLHRNAAARRKSRLMKRLTAATATAEGESTAAAGN